MITSGESIPAAQAAAMGLASDVVPSEKLLESAEERVVTRKYSRVARSEKMLESEG